MATKKRERPNANRDRFIMNMLALTLRFRPVAQMMGLSEARIMQIWQRQRREHLRG